jgi:G:T-mismatch repair DNA endonuclease (very short patch repair protein)
MYRLSKEERSLNMNNINSKDTLPEIKIRLEWKIIIIWECTTKKILMKI